MTSGIGIVGSAAGSTITPVAPAPTSSSETFTVPQASTIPSSPSSEQQSPRILLDPSAGFITQYLSANGSQVVSQTPTAITVAYMRLGLTPDGLSKPPTETVATTA